MQVRVGWTEGLTFLGKSISGHQILVDDNSDDKVLSLTEMVLVVVDGYSAIDMASILQKGRQDAVDYEVRLTPRRHEEAPHLLTHINLHLIVTDCNLKDAVAAHVAGLSVEGYCSVALILEKTVNITRSYKAVAA